MFISFSNGNGSAFENSLEDILSQASLRDVERQRCWKDGSEDGQRLWDYFFFFCQYILRGWPDS